MPTGMLRQVETGDTALVHVLAVWEPDQDPNRSRAPSRRGLNPEAALSAGAPGIRPELDSHIQAIKKALTI